jgi:hypothetical protein
VYTHKARVLSNAPDGCKSGVLFSARDTEGDSMESNSASAPTPSATEETTAEAKGDLEVVTGAKSFTSHPADIQFSPGTRFKLGELTVELAHCLSLDRIVVTELRTGETRVVTRGDLRAVTTTLDAKVERSVQLESLGEEQLAELTVREELLKPYIGGHVMSSLEAHHLAKKLGVSARTVRRWLRRYQRRGDVTGLLPAPRGVRHGQRSLDPSVEAIICPRCWMEEGP